MPFKKYAIFSYGGHFNEHSGTVLAIKVVCLIRNI